MRDDGDLGQIVRAAPITLAEANRYVAAMHRHNGSLPAAKFAVAALDDDGSVHGVVIAGAPKARMAADTGVLEVSRVCTDGEPNCCSFLYARIVRAAKALGYTRLITYTLEREGGASLKASGWVRESSATGGGSWSRADRPRMAEVHDTGAKVRWGINTAPTLPRLIWPAEIVPPVHPSLWEDAA